MNAPRPRLSPALLGALPAAVRRPPYAREALTTGIVHLGIGAFARAHLLPFTEAALDAAGESAWGVAGVSLRQPDTRDALSPQHGLYTMALRDGSGERLQVIGALTTVRVAPEDPRATLACIAAGATRIVSLTVTEKGYCHDPATGTLRLDQPDIAHDLAAALPSSAPGFIVRGLAQRREAGLGGVTLLSLDNLPGNGETLRRVVVTFAEAVEPALARWIERECTFPNSMVDRIVPRTTDDDRERIATALGADDAWPVVGEPFAEWVVEDRFAAGRPAWERGGARIVERAEPYELLKLRMVNGCHSTLAWLGTLAGLSTVDEALRTPALRELLLRLMRDEVEPTLPEVTPAERAHYRERLLERFANPALRHRLLQIAMDSSQKLPQRLLGTVRDRLRSGQPWPLLALAVAAWLRFMEGRDDQERPIAIDDPLAAALAQEHARRGTLLHYAPVFGDLAGEARFTAGVAAASAELRRHGALAAAAFYTAGDAAGSAG